MPEGDLLSFGSAMLAALAVGALAYAFLYPYFSGEREKDSRLKGVIESKGRETANGPRAGDFAPQVGRQTR